MSRRRTTVLTLLTLCSVVLAMLVTRRLYLRLDLSAGKSHTLSDVSKNLYREIPEQLTVTYYLSDKLAKAHPAPGEIIDLLREYAAHSRGRIRVVLKDPIQSGSAAAAERLGILPQQIQTVEQDQAGVATVYTGIVLEYLDTVDVLPVVFSLDGLEYDLSSRIRALAAGTQREVGVLVAAADRSWQEDFVYLDQAFSRAGYRVRLFSAGEEIPNTLPTLFVFGGVEELEPWDLYRIDRYLVGGGKILFALEGVFVDSRSDLAARPMADGGLLSMLESYGVRVETQLVLDTASLTIPYQSVAPEGTMQTRLMRYPHWVAVLEENGNPDHPISAVFSGLDLFWPSPLTLLPPPGVSAEILATGTENAWRMTKDFVTAPEMETAFGREAGETKGRPILAAALTGRFRSFFENKPKPLRGGSDNTLSDPSRSPKNGRIAIVGDGDLATTLIQYTRSERNLDFLLKAADWLGNDEDMLGIRNRSSSVGRLDRIQDPIRRARAALFSRTLNTVLVPALVILFALGRMWKRRSAAKAGATRDVL